MPCEGPHFLSEPQRTSIFCMDLTSGMEDYQNLAAFILTMSITDRGVWYNPYKGAPRAAQ